MLARLRGARALFLGGACVLIGALLFVAAWPFAEAWFLILSATQTPTAVIGPCGTQGGAACQVITYIRVLPSPYPIFAAYAVATPLVFVVAWIIRRSPPSGHAAVRPGPLLPRVISALLAGAVGWVGLFIAAGFGMDWLGIPVYPWVRFLFILSLFAAPVLIIAAGGVYLSADLGRWFSGRSRGAAG